MKTIPAMVDMARSQKDKEDSVAVNPIDAVPTYPYGLCISLCEDELDKLNLDTQDVGIGDMIHLFCMATVTSISKNDNQNGSSCRVELQITHISSESEDEENEEEDQAEDKSKKDIPSRLYKSS